MSPSQTNDTGFFGRYELSERIAEGRTCDVFLATSHGVEGFRRTVVVKRLREDLAEGEYAILEITDTGCGMDEETRSKVFDPFFTTKFTGRGLGLAVVLGIVSGHKGAISIQSKPAAGTTVRVLFPIVNKETK